MVWGLQMPSDACVPQTADKRKQEVLGYEVGDAAAGLATAYRGPYNGTLPRLSGRRLQACWTWIMARPESRELRAQSDNLPVRGRVWLRFFWVAQPERGMSAREIGNIALVSEVVQAVPRPSVRLGPSS